MTRKRPNLTKELKAAVAQFLLLKCVDGKIIWGAQRQAAECFKISERVVRRIWQEAQDQIAAGQPLHFKHSHHGIQHSSKRKFDPKKVEELNVHDRTTIRQMAKHLCVGKSTVGRWKQDGLIKPHTNAIKPFLTLPNAIARLKYSLSFVKGLPENGKFKFHSMVNTIHIDEKWFFMTKTSERFYLLPEEEEPYRSCKSKRFITNVMFLCAVGRPQFAENGECIFDGKIGIFPFTTREPAKRNSKNRKQGTLETKPIHSVTKEVIKHCLINQVIPAIKAKWPTNRSKDIIIQQDNAKPHISTYDPDFLVAANSDGFQIHLVCQPSNSPDCNVNDLGFFRAIQSLQDKKMAKNVDDLLQNVHQSFEELSAITLNNVWITLQGCFVEMLKVRGSNNYKIPHMDKGRMMRLQQLPNYVEVEESLIRECLDFLRQPENDCGNDSHLSHLYDVLGYPIV